jgi:molybdopterin converting factor small subunit
MARDICERESVDLMLDNDARISDLRRALSREIPAISTILRSSTFAVGAQYVDDQFTLKEGDEAACIPPVSGG